MTNDPVPENLCSGVTNRVNEKRKTRTEPKPQEGEHSQTRTHNGSYFV